MVAGSRGDGGAPKYRLSSKMQATIDSVREIVGPHSDSEILAVLRETNMDANETVQRLLYQGMTFYKSLLFLLHYISSEVLFARVVSFSEELLSSLVFF